MAFIIIIYIAQTLIDAFSVAKVKIQITGLLIAVAGNLIRFLGIATVSPMANGQILFVRIAEATQP